MTRPAPEPATAQSCCKALKYLFSLRLISLFLLGSIASPTLASENGGGNYGFGVQTVMAGALPPPGMTLFGGYVVYYSADSFRGDDGDALVPGFKADVHVQAMRAVHSWGSYKGLTLSSSVILESIYAEIEAGGQHDSDFGPTLIDFEPLRIGLQLGNWHLQTGTYFWFPLGDYDANAIANSSYGYTTISQSIDASWLPTPQWEISLDAHVSFNFENSDTNYHSGDQYGLTYHVGYRPFVSNPKWQFGLNGFYVKQFNDDELNGMKVPGGFRLRKFAVGPQIGYWFSPAVAVMFKWQAESSVRNAPRGDSFWLQAGFPLPI